MVRDRRIELRTPAMSMNYYSIILYRFLILKDKNMAKLVHSQPVQNLYNYLD